MEFRCRSPGACGMCLLVSRLLEMEDWSRSETARRLKSATPVKSPSTQRGFVMSALRSIPNSAHQCIPSNDKIPPIRCKRRSAASCRPIKLHTNKTSPPGPAKTYRTVLTYHSVKHVEESGKTRYLYKYRHKKRKRNCHIGSTLPTLRLRHRKVQLFTPAGRRQHSNRSHGNFTWSVAFCSWIVCRCKANPS